MISIIIFSDIRIYCEGLTRILSGVDSLRIVGAESHFENALEKIDRLKPDVILLDMTMSGSCRAAKKIMQHFPDAHIVALAAPEDEKNVIRCAEVGISGYVAREASLDELIETVKSAQIGEVCYPPKIATYIFNRFRQVSAAGQKFEEHKTDLPGKRPSQMLTGREQQIAGLMAEGLSNKQISRNLSIEVSTVKNHVHNILVKLDVRSRVQVVAILQTSENSSRSRSIDLDRKLEMSY